MTASASRTGCYPLRMLDAFEMPCSLHNNIHAQGCPPRPLTCLVDFSRIPPFPSQTRPTNIFLSRPTNINNHL